MTRLLLILVAVLMAGPSAWSATYNSDGSVSDVQSKWNSASDGDIITIPAGSFTWTSGLSLSGKGAKITGAGGGTIHGWSKSSVSIGTGTKAFTVRTGLRWQAGNTIVAVHPRTGESMTGTVTSYSGTTLTLNIASTSGSGTKTLWVFENYGATVLTFNTSSGTMFDVTKDASHRVEVTDLDITRGTATGKIFNFAGTGKSPIVRNGRYNMGDDANSTFYCQANGVIISKIGAVTDYSWPDGLSGSDYVTTGFVDIQFGNLNDTWQAADTMGARDTDGEANVYMEDCTLVGFPLEAIDTSDNAKFVCRYNEFIHSAWTSHGLDTGNAGLRHCEGYNNWLVFEAGDAACNDTLAMDYFIYLRGGIWALLDNDIDDIGGSCMGDKSEIRGQIQALNRNAGPYACYSGGYPMLHQHGRNYYSGSEITQPICINGNTGSGSVTLSLNNYHNPVASGGDECSSSEPPPQAITTYVIAGRDVTNGAPNTVWASQGGYAKFTYPHPSIDGSDGIVPTVDTVTISANGTTWTFACSETVTIGAGGNGGFTTSMSGGAVTLTYSSGSGSSSLVYTGNRTVMLGESGTLSYTQPGNGVEDTAGNDLVTFTGKTVVNNSSQTGDIPPVSGVRALPLRISR